MEKAGVNYEGLYHLGNGAPLSSLLWGCIAIFAITDRPLRGAYAAVFAAVLSYCGIIHEHVPVFGGERPMMFAISYLMLAALLALKHYFNQRDALLAVK